jgi:hypothetical protein
MDKSPGYALRYVSNNEKDCHYNLTSERLLKINLPEIETYLSRKTVFTNNYTFSILQQDEKEHLKLSVTVNDMKSNTFHLVDTPQGHMRTGKAIDFSNVKGKTFHVIATDRGKELAFLDVGPLKAVNRTQSGEEILIGIEKFFVNILFDLPEKNINIGDSWRIENKDTTVNEEGLEQTVAYETLFRFEGVEQINDRACLKIVMDSKGTVSGVMTHEKRNYSDFNGDFEDSGTIYIDAEDAVIVKLNTLSMTKGKAKIFTAIGYLTEPFTSKRTLDMVLLQQ